MEELLIQALRAGIRFHAENGELRVTAPQGALTPELRESLKQHKQAIMEYLTAKEEERSFVFRPDPASRFEPFPLMEMQHAYWFGRDSSMEMGGVGTHFYVELDCERLDVDRLNQSLCRLIDHHDMLRAIVEKNGLQRILPSVPPYQIRVHDHQSSTIEEADQAINAVRQELSHQVFAADQWPLFEIRATLLPCSRVRLHVSLDLLIFDLWSMFMFFREWHQLYEQPASNIPPLHLSFRDYVLAERTLQEHSDYRRAYQYWMSKIETLPAAPDLPLRADVLARQKPRFTQREFLLGRDRWQKLKERSLAKGLTPSVLLLAAFSEVLTRWSATSHFTLNLTVSNRLPLHEQVGSLLGDFTSSVLQEVDRRDHQLSFIEFALQLQKQFSSNMDHREVSGVTVLREWAKRHGVSLQAAMPVVFTSGLVRTGEKEVGHIEQFGRKVYSISQTPQVWLDHHVMELHGELNLIWVTSDAVFEPGVVDAMFTSYGELVGRLADDPTLWDHCDVVPLPERMNNIREETNRTAAEKPSRRLHAGFVKQAIGHPKRVAIYSQERIMTYGELLEESCAVADWLVQCGVEKGKQVAILMHKGWEQIVAVMGVLLAGGAYMPVEANLPTKRQQDLLQIGEVSHLLTQPGILRADLVLDDIQVRVVQQGAKGELCQEYLQELALDLDEMAYVIFTSGTTGIPKGVTITHLGAANTVEHMNRLFKVSHEDRVLAVSSLSFDLSVYDIFGLLGAGGAIIIPDYRKGHDPLHWRDLMANYSVTLWNSAPQLMSMLMDSYAAGEQAGVSLRKVWLSGDFIPLDLPKRIQQGYPGSEVISLGGATEASIWSIYYPIQQVDPTWAAIPYGKPLPNQTIWVYDGAFRARPDYVKGRIYIGGIGLAEGYWNDEEKTASRFVRHPTTGERLYDTGDLGRYAEDGKVLILGRDDNQVKIRGHRVELGEIETVLRQHPDIQRAVVLATSGHLENKQLVAFIVPSENESAGQSNLTTAPSCLNETIREYLASGLPDYMVPRHILEVSSIPVTANGKADYQALLAMAELTEGTHRDFVKPRNEQEQRVLDVWCGIFGTELGITDNFFDLGGDSVLAVQLMQALNKTMPGFKLEMHELFENLTVESLAKLYLLRTEGDSDEAALSTAVAPSVDHEAALADVQEAIEIVTAIDYHAGTRSHSRPKTVFVTGGTGWIGVHVLAELLSQTDVHICCLVRNKDLASSRERLLEKMQHVGIPVEASWISRMELVQGDLMEPMLGIDAANWNRIAENTDAIYHLGASVNVLAEYSAHRRTNVAPIVTIAQLAADRHLKPVYYLSPMAVNRRFIDDRLVVLHEECDHPDPDGLLTGYSQSKWAAEQVLLAASKRGLPVKIYRASHALPSARSGMAKPSDTYSSVLHAAYVAGVVPEWTDSALYGVPVDTLASLLVENSMTMDDYAGIIHVENQSALSMKELVQILLLHQGRQGGSTVSLDEWKSQCKQAAASLPPERAQLASILFANRGASAAVDNMFASYSLDTSYFMSRGKESKLSNLTPPEYWFKVCDRLKEKEVGRNVFSS